MADAKIESYNGDLLILSPKTGEQWPKVSLSVEGTKLQIRIQFDLHTVKIAKVPLT